MSLVLVEAGGRARVSTNERKQIKSERPEPGYEYWSGT